MLAAMLLSLCLSQAGSMPDAKSLGPQTLTLHVGHKFSTGEAHVRVQQLLDYWKKRFGVTCSWSGEKVFVTGKIFSVDFKAILEVTDQEVACESSDPGGLWRGFARDYVGKKLKKYLHPTYQET